jgi:hypothetical protein
VPSVSVPHSLFCVNGQKRDDVKGIRDGVPIRYLLTRGQDPSVMYLCHEGVSVLQSCGADDGGNERCVLGADPLFSGANCRSGAGSGR